MATVSLVELTKRFGDKAVVDRLSLEVADGEFLVILGPSGCGKTTTMRMVAGLETISDGEVRIGDRIVNDLPPKHRDVAMVFQSYALYPHMNVFRNIEYPLRVRRVEQEERRAAVQAAAKRVNLDGLLDRLPRELSGGERQRVALARAIIRTPQVFLMDEPLSNLDASLRGRMRAELKHLQRELKITTIYVTHDQVEAMTLADRIAVMRDGTLQQLGSPREIYREPANLFVAGFIGAPGMSFLEGRLEAGVFLGPSIAVETPVAATSSSVVLGVRAEDLTMVSPEEADLVAPIYTTELTGDATLVSLEVADSLLVVRANRDFPGRDGEVVGVRVARSAIHLFEGSSGQRLHATAL